MRLAVYGDQGIADEASADAAESAADELASGDAERCALLTAGIADPTRVRLLNLLAAGELCVCDLVQVLQLPQPTVSRHLAYLRRSGWVQASRGPRLAHYRLSEPANAVHAGLLQWVRESLPSLPGLASERVQGEAACAERRRIPC
jgi:ArsR family transcriptional regulator, arsenate/arsenite/antimonite-responsive transcriptional repressor